MKTISRRTLLGTAASGLAASIGGKAFAGASYDPGASDQEIRIGQFGPLSGPVSSFGVLANAMDAYFRMLNDTGGINVRTGNEFALAAYDDREPTPGEDVIAAATITDAFNPLTTTSSSEVMHYLYDWGRRPKERMPQEIVKHFEIRFELRIVYDRSSSQLYCCNTLPNTNVCQQTLRIGTNGQFSPARHACCTQCLWPVIILDMLELPELSHRNVRNAGILQETIQKFIDNATYTTFKTTKNKLSMAELMAQTEKNGG